MRRRTAAATAAVVVLFAVGGALAVWGPRAGPPSAVWIRARRGTDGGLAAWEVATMCDGDRRPVRFGQLVWTGHGIHDTRLHVPSRAPPWTVALAKLGLVSADSGVGHVYEWSRLCIVDEAGVWGRFDRRP